MRRQALEGMLEMEPRRINKSIILNSHSSFRYLKRSHYDIVLHSIVQNKKLQKRKFNNIL